MTKRKSIQMLTSYRNIPSLYGVILGAHRISQPSGFEQNRTVNRIEIHPLYDTVTFNYDVALIEVSFVSDSIIF